MESLDNERNATDHKVSMLVKIYSLSKLFMFLIFTLI